tara:strand:- start:890 stop:1066 length:177 start_codon:yes stop_codon:yes gene_type:complete
MMTEEKRIITSESMVSYYVGVLKYTTSKRHRKYINQMIGYFSGKIKIPDEETFFKYNE